MGHAGHQCGLARLAAVWRARARGPLLALALAACGAAAPAPELAAEPEETLALPHCNPLAPAHCLLPWPASVYLDEDPSTATGYRVAYPLEAMPRNVAGQPIDPARYNLLDGFSVASQLLVSFTAGVSPAGLPAADDLAASLATDSLVGLIELSSGERVPLFAEVDANATAGQLAALIIRPQRPLAFDRRYAAYLRRGLRDAAGDPLVAPDPFRRLRDGRDTADPRLESLRGRTEEVLDRLAALGVPREEVLLAWDFHTASRDATLGPLLGMVDDALARLPDDGPALAGELTVTERTEEEDPSLLREVSGELLVPSYLERDASASRLALDPRGQPVHRGARRVRFWIAIPRCAATARGPLPVLLYGHGLFGSPAGEMISDYMSALENRLCVVGAATTWYGISIDDGATILGQVMPDFSNLPLITDQLAQSQVNWHALVRALQGALVQQPALQVDGRSVIDDAEIYYFGLSGGGTQGPALLAASPAISRAVLHVTGGWFSMLLQRTAAYSVLAPVVARHYPDATDRLIAFSLAQQLWDTSDAPGFARHVLLEPLAGRQPKQVLLQEARADELMPNLATRAVARALGLQGLAPQLEPVFGIDAADGPLSSAYTQWDTGAAPAIPAGNQPPAMVPKADSPHYRLRKLDGFYEQVEAFLRPGGQVIAPRAARRGGD